MKSQGGPGTGVMGQSRQCPSQLSAQGDFSLYLFPDLLGDVIQFTGQCMHLQGCFKPLLIQEQVVMESLPPDQRMGVNLAARGGTRPLFQPHSSPQPETDLSLSWLCRWQMVSDSSGLWFLSCSDKFLILLT